MAPEATFRVGEGSLTIVTTQLLVATDTSDSVDVSIECNGRLTVVAMFAMVVWKRQEE